MSIWKREIYKHSRRAYFCTVKSQFFYFGQFGQIFRTSPRKCGTPYIFRRKRKWDFSSSLKLPNYFLVTIRRKSKLQMLLSPEPRPLIGWPIRALGSCLSLHTLEKAFQNHLSYFLTKYFFSFLTKLPFPYRYGFRTCYGFVRPYTFSVTQNCHSLTQFYGKSLWS